MAPFFVLTHLTRRRRGPMCLVSINIIYLLNGDCCVPIWLFKEELAVGLCLFVRPLKKPLQGHVNSGILLAPLNEPTHTSE